MEASTIKKKLEPVKYPEMTVEAVSKMYHEENKNMHEIADYFGVNKSKVNNFISNNKLSRKAFIKADGFRDAIVEQKRKERP